MPAVNFIIYGYYPSGTNPGVIVQDRVIDENLKSQIKNRTLHTCRLFLLFRIFQYVNNLIYLQYIFNIRRVIIFPNFSR